MSKRDTRLYLIDIENAIEKIESYTSHITFDQFKDDAKTIDAVVRNIEIIGEASRYMTEEERKKYPSVPWTLMIAARNKAIHEYFGIDVVILWQTVKEDIPLLKKELAFISK